MCTITKRNWISETNHNQFAENNIMTIIIHKYQIIIIFIYIPPNEDEMNDKISTNTFRNLEKIIQLFNILKYIIIIMGDFNARIIDTGDRITNQSGQLLKQLCQIHKLEILNTNQTFGQRTYHNFKTKQLTFSIVDYVIINTNIRLKKCTPQIDIIKAFTESDHFPIRLTFDIPEYIIINKQYPQLPKIIITRDKTKLKKILQKE
ncbi:hypothetical protein RFI_29389 [Reticulomyxa filosa]|uniref:Endonuclease/exonuclease/phosphatase domain-containing protein n=1 Tax=Reticulomyxa filosa TaxID=46433 RepID=X6M4N1_RETFI|nr:hypothetical protein RFI_29389 [Reticulomyxa filosa]|eukprot:ETO08000.1 hypothetical protein RFI_29389 [Reticulomyxa filosa]